MYQRAAGTGDHRYPGRSSTRGGWSGPTGVTAWPWWTWTSGASGSWGGEAVSGNRELKGRTRVTPPPHAAYATHIAVHRDWPHGSSPCGRSAARAARFGERPSARRLRAAKRSSQPGERWQIYPTSSARRVGWGGVLAGWLNSALPKAWCGVIREAVRCTFRRLRHAELLSKAPSPSRIS